MTKAYAVGLTPWGCVPALLLMSAVFGLAQQAGTTVGLAPTLDGSKPVPEPLSARQQWTMLRLSEQLTRKAELLDKKGKRDEAERAAERALALQEQVRGPSHLEVARSVDRLADLYAAHKKDSAAEPLYQRAEGIRNIILSAHPDVYDRDGSTLKIRRSQPADKAGPVEPPH